MRLPALGAGLIRLYTGHYIELVVLPTAEACRMLRSVDDHDVHAVLHVTY